MSRTDAVLFQDAEAWGLASSSPQCLVAQAALKFAGVPYSTSTATDSSASSSERPVLTIGNAVLTGAGQILDHLKSNYGLDARLDSKQVARAYAFQSMIEDRLHKAWQYNMFVDDDNFASTTKPVITQGAPFGSAFLISYQLRNSVRKSLDGISDSCLRSVPQSYAALSALLGDSPYFCGDRPGSLDAVAFGHLALQLHATTPNQPFAAAMRPYPNLKSFVENVNELYFAKGKAPEIDAFKWKGVEGAINSELPESAVESDALTDDEKKFRSRSWRFLGGCAVVSVIFALTVLTDGESKS